MKALLPTAHYPIGDRPRAGWFRQVGFDRLQLPGEESTVVSLQDPTPAARRPPMKFYYASGSRPLSGYTIKRGIGAGGFGEVYYATSDAGKEVALKRVQRNLDVELRGVSQCLNLKHPNLLTVFDIKYDDEGQAWIVMEYMAGDNLQQAIDRYSQGLPLDQVHHWFRGIAAGVAALHDQGIVHRDLKPANIFLDQGVVKVGDYGLSKFISCSRRSGQTESVGTFHYMAPEIGRGCYGREIDIYALGILLYELLTGRVPYDGETSHEIIMKHLTAEPDLDAVPIPYRAVIARALDKDPALRPTNVSAMMQDMPAVEYSHLDNSPTARVVEPAEGAHAVGVTQVGNGSGESCPIVFAKDVVLEPSSPHVTPLTPLVAPTPLPRAEPIGEMVRASWTSFRSAWRNANLNTTARFFLQLLAVLMLVLNAEWILPLAATLVVLYAIYLMFWSLFHPSSASPHEPMASAPAASLALAVQAEPQRVDGRGLKRPRNKRRVRWQTAALQQLTHKSLWQRVTELSGSLLMSALVCAVVCVVMLIVGSERIMWKSGSDLFSWLPEYLWMTLSAIAGSWLVLTLSKFHEGQDEDPWLQRFGQLTAGLALGGFSWALATFLHVDPTYVPEIGQLFDDIHPPTSLYAEDGTPRALAYLGYFGGLLGLVRWWRQTDPLRSARLSMFATVSATLAALFLHIFLPNPRGLILAAVMAMSVQLAAPWYSQAQRERFRQIAEESADVTA